MTQDKKIGEPRKDSGLPLDSGEIVTCPQCKVELMHLKRTVRAGDILLADDFEGLGDYPAPSNGEPVFRHCGELPIRVNMRGMVEVHVERGWVR